MSVIQWLLDADPWVEYGARIDLLGQPEANSLVSAARKRLLSSPALQAIVENLRGWPGKVLNSHKSASQPFHKLAFLSEVGFRIDDPYMKEIAKRMLAHTDEEGIVQLPMNISKAYGGSGTDTWAWALCDAPTNLYILAKLGLEDPRLEKGTKYLASLIRDNGWPCAVSKELGKWRGPGRKDDPCPYATLVMLKLLSARQEYMDSSEANKGIDALCTLWDSARERHPYMFYMGTDFRKLKAPLLWYDILHVVDVLSRFPYARKKKQVREMVSLIRAKQDAEGKYVPESVWQEWKGWDFGQKKEPSPYLTLFVHRAFKRLGERIDA